MPKSGHYYEGFGAFKNHATGRYFVAMVDDRGFAPDPPEPVAHHSNWFRACDDADRRGKAAIREHDSLMGQAWRLSDELKAKASVGKGQWPRISLNGRPI